MAPGGLGAAREVTLAVIPALEGCNMQIQHAALHQRGSSRYALPRSPNRQYSSHASAAVSIALKHALLIRCILEYRCQGDRTRHLIRGFRALFRRPPYLDKIIRLQSPIQMRYGRGSPGAALRVGEDAR